MSGTVPAHIHHTEPTSFWRKYVFSTDHKVIAKQYLWTGIAWLVIAGAMALLIRWQLANPFEEIPFFGGIFFSHNDGKMTPEAYNMLFTMHGSLMVFFAITPILFGAFGNYVIPLQIGADDMAFPTLNMVSFWTVTLGTVIMVVSFFVPDGAASAGWTTYPPLSSSTEFTLGWGQTLWLVGILAAGTSTLMGAINFIATTLNMRCEGMTLMRLPLTIWGFFYSSVLSLLWVPVVAVALFMVVTDRVFGTNFLISGPFAPAEGGQPLLFQHLFWGFGHPEVYILILPVWGIVADLLACFCRKPAFGYKLTVLSMATITAVSSIVWGHHMFTSGMNPILGKAFMLLTITISVPTAVFFFNWLATLWKGAMQLTAPMLYTLGIVFVFAIGGLTGLHNAVQALDIYIHDTYFVVGHFHYTLAASVLFGAYGGVAFWYPKMFGKKMSPMLLKIHFWLTFILLNVLFFSMMRVGIHGHPRRIADPSGYSFLDAMQPWQDAMSHAAMALGIVQLIFVFAFFKGLAGPRDAGNNPWGAATLEWQTSSPPPWYNFEAPPVVDRGPYDYSPEDDHSVDFRPQGTVPAGGAA
ncbi:MAG: cytochrome c oxidase subunit I [Planctomycetota bacterium]